LTVPSQTIFRNLENIQCVLSQFIRLSRSQSQPYIPDITISSPSVSLNDIKSRQDTAAPWSWTASEATSAETALLPFLIHLAAARDDLESMSFCLESAESPELQQRTIPGGLVNCTQQVSGSSPLHVAALNGSERCVDALLRSGALVHLRDLLEHTALYYVSFQMLCLPLESLTTT
jgi:60kDa lysophospholipase